MLMIGARAELGSVLTYLIVKSTVTDDLVVNRAMTDRSGYYMCADVSSSQTDLVAALRR